MVSLANLETSFRGLDEDNGISFEPAPIIIAECCHFYQCDKKGKLLLILLQVLVK